MEVSGQGHAPAALYHWERVLWMGGWVGLRAGLETEVKGKIIAFPGFRTRYASL
jgi:hypothetical protein